MAVKEKIPTPTEISGESKKFTEEEIKQITDLQGKTQQILFQLGQVKLNEMQLEKRYEEIKNALVSIEQEEQALAASFSEKYGQGSLNIETGEFTPNK
jgi:hypothetical protein|tara:strand:- start:1181 stop:1474 length:294 start_codon:yes stop_codon:yes gene_type:complete